MVRCQHLFLVKVRWFLGENLVLGHRHMSSEGPYVTTIVCMFRGAQVYQEEPSDPIAGKAEAKTQEHRREPSPLIASKVEAQA